MIKIYLAILISFLPGMSNGQSGSLTGRIVSGGIPIAFASVTLQNGDYGTTSDSSGKFTFRNLRQGNYILDISFVGYYDYKKPLTIHSNEDLKLSIELYPNNNILNEVVITGVSRATLIRENPIAITSISEKQIEHTIESNIIDILVKNVPGLNAVKTGANISKPFIRGLGYNRVLTLYDGLRQEGQQWGDEHAIEVDDYNIGRAEVIKGPASLMYGSDALAGVVSFFPHIPRHDDKKLHGRVISEYQTNNNLIGTGFRLGYNTDRFLFAVRGSYRMAKNYRNPVDGRVYLTNFNEKNISSLVGFTSEKGYTHFNITLYDNKQAIPDGSRDSITRKFTKQVNDGDEDIIRERPIVSSNELNAYHIPALSQHIRHYRIYQHSFYRVGKGDVDLLLGVQQNIRSEYNHPTMPEQPGMNVRLNTLNYSLRYNAPKFSNIETSIGVNGMLQNNKSLNATDFPIPDYNLFDLGMYAYGKWKLKKWSASGGVRYDKRWISWDDFYVRENSKTGFDDHVHVPDTSGATLQFQSYKKSFHGVSASLGTLFQATNHLSIKVNVGTAYRAPNITEMASNGLDPGAHIIYLGNRYFVPEFSLQEDVGISARFKNFSGDISIFNNHIDNYIYLSLVVDDQGNPIVDAQENRTYQYQQAAAQLYGSEVWLSFHPDKLNGFRFDNSLSMVYGFNRQKSFNDKSHEGEYLPLIPPLKILSSIAQSINLKSSFFSSMTPKLEMEFEAAQDRYLGLNNTESGTPSYTLLNLGIVTEIKYAAIRKFQFQLQVNNLLNKAYQSHLSRLKYFEYFSDAPGQKSGVYNMGRNIICKIVFPF